MLWRVKIWRRVSRLRSLDFPRARIGPIEDPFDGKAFEEGATAFGVCGRGIGVDVPDFGVEGQEEREDDDSLEEDIIH